MSNFVHFTFLEVISLIVFYLQLEKNNMQSPTNQGNLNMVLFPRIAVPSQGSLQEGVSVSVAAKRKYVLQLGEIKVSTTIS